jgi:hypothetical protein
MRPVKNRPRLQHSHERIPKLISAESFNRVLLVGGKNLSLFQSFGLVFMAWLPAALAVRFSSLNLS